MHLSDDLSMAMVYIALQIADSRSTDIQAKGNEMSYLLFINNTTRSMQLGQTEADSGIPLYALCMYERRDRSSNCAGARNQTTISEHRENWF